MFPGSVDRGRFPATAKFRTARGIEAVKDRRRRPRSGASKASVLYGFEATRENRNTLEQKQRPDRTTKRKATPGYEIDAFSEIDDRWSP